MTARPLQALAAALLLGALAAAQDAAPPAPSFHADVLPLLQVHCQGCHQPAIAKGDLVLMGHADLLVEVDGEPLVAPGAPEKSVLLDVVTPVGTLAPEMPKKGKPLSTEEIGLLRDWIAAGAADDSPASEESLPGPDDPPRYPAAPVLTALAFAPDGATLAVSGRHEVLLHDVAALASGTPAPPRRLIGASPRIESIAWSPDGATLAVAGGAPARFGELQLWDPAKGKLRRSVRVSYDTLRGLSWSPDGALIAFGCTDKSVRAIEADKGEEVLYQGAHDDWVLDTTFSLDGSHLISVGRDRSAKLTKVATQQFIDDITSITPGAMKGGLSSVECRPGHDEILVGGADGEPKLYRIFREKKREIGDDFNRIRAYEPFVGRVTDVGWSADGTRLFAGASLSNLADPPRGGAVRAYDVEGTVLWTRVLDAAVFALAVDPLGRWVAVGGFDGRLRLLDAESGETRVELVPVPLTGGGDGLEASGARAVEAAAPGTGTPEERR